MVTSSWRESDMDKKKEMSLWEREFPGWKFDDRFEADVMPQLEDMSWHNDTMPSFCEPKAGLRVWVAHLEPSEREHPTNSYAVDKLCWDGECWVDNSDPHEGRAIFETNEVTELLTFLKEGE
tara:strand:- start:706 stop:1071 length:366 start_codon:yes stop_codon:yes gene_type:complete